MNLGLHELGPLAEQSTRTVKINSTCTVFAGAELRERLSLGEKREDILAGLHRAIMLRAMTLLARSGGVSDEFTFTGGVAKNPAAVRAIRELVEENYGARTINISADSIYTGALGAALFAQKDGELMHVSAGIDVGSGAVKVMIFRTAGVPGETDTVLAKVSSRIRRREVSKVVDEVFHDAIDAAGVDEIHYIATTGEGNDVRSPPATSTA